MLICLFLCAAAAILPTGFSQPDEISKVSPSTSPAQRYAVAAADAMRSLQRLRILLRRLQNGEPIESNESTSPEENFSLGLWSVDSSPFRQALDSIYGDRSLRSTIVSRALDSIGGGHLLRRATVLDSIGGGNLLRRESALDSIGGGHLLKRDQGYRVLDSIGGGHLLKRNSDSIYGGAWLKQFGNVPRFDSIGEEDFPKSTKMNSIEGRPWVGEGNVPKRGGFGQLDSLGGGHLLKREAEANL